MRRAEVPVRGRLRSAGTQLARKAKKRPARQPLGGLIATVPSSEIGLTDCKQRDITKSNSHSEATFGNHHPPSLSSGAVVIKRQGDDRGRHPRKSLVATLPKAGFELTRCKQGRSQFSSSNKNGTFWNWPSSPARSASLENLWELKSRRVYPPGAPPPGHPFEVYGTYLSGPVKLFTRNRHRSFGGVNCPGRCIIRGRFLRRSL